MAPIELQDERNMLLSRQAAVASTSTSAPLSSGVIIGIAVAGSAILILVSSVVIYLIIRKRKQHRLAMAELEGRVPSISTIRQMEQAPCPVSGIRCGRLVPLPQSQAGWDALGSNDTINEPVQPVKWKRGSVSLPKRLKGKGIPLKRFKHLSAIMESPRSQSRKSSAVPSLRTVESVTEMIGSPGKLSIGKARSTNEVVLPRMCGAMEQEGSPHLDVLPSFAIISPSRYGASIANDEDRPPPAMRSVSTGVLDADGAVFGSSEHYEGRSSRLRPEMHARSISQGAPLTKPPSRPVPPLPVIAPLDLKTETSLRQGVCVSRMSSSSSINSAGSSVLITSQILNRSDENHPLSSPTVEEIVAEKDNAELKIVAGRQWQNPRIAGPRPNSSMRIEKSRASVRGNIVRYSSDSVLSCQLSSASTASPDTTGRNRLSIPQIATADRVSISRVSSTNSLTSNLVQQVDTPPRRHSSRVSASGSPTERKKKTNSVLRDISGNASPRRQMSMSTQKSNRSSNGNPFQWDNESSNSLTKPSAMKGSPNARKGHRRQNCVRISTSTPQVLGPRSRSASPAGILMAEIVEERESDELKRESSKRPEVERIVAKERRRSRPPMPNRTASSESNLRIQTLRASLTPSSRTLSTWNAYNDPPALPSQHSDTNMSAMSASPCHRSESRASNQSAFVIPKFPSPSKARASVALSQLDTAPMPQFSLDMESPILGFDDRKPSSPFALDMSSDETTPVESSPAQFLPVSPIDMPSSPPVPVAKFEKYDPAWPMVAFPEPKNEYDPASPPIVWHPEDGEDNDRSSSYFLPFALSELDSDEISPKSRPTSCIEDDRPVSPKTVPDFRPHSFVAGPEKLTSENASSIMARMPGKSLGTSSFLGAQVPVLSPPGSGYEDLPLPQWQPQQPAPVANMGHSRQRSVSNVNFRPPRTRTGPPAPGLPTIPQSDDSPPSAVPSPLHVSAPAAEDKQEKQVPKGPRTAPGKSVLRNAMALRRMNSEARVDEGAESRNYVRLGREASPLLPWIGIQDLNDSESCNDLFDFDFDARARADEDQDRTPTRQQKTSAMDEIDIKAIEKNIDGALAGFDAEFKAWSSPYSKRTSPGAQRNSSVWNDGEKFWEDQLIAKSREVVPQVPEVQYTDTTPSRLQEEQTSDPRLLSTPVSKYGSSPIAGAGSVQVTPASLYDDVGFLKE